MKELRQLLLYQLKVAYRWCGVMMNDLPRARALFCVRALTAAVSIPSLTLALCASLATAQAPALRVAAPVAATSSQIVRPLTDSPADWTKIGTPRALADFKKAIQSIAESPDGRLLAISIGFGQGQSFPEIVLWDILRETELYRLGGIGSNLGWVHSIVFTNDGCCLISADAGFVRLWDLATRKSISSAKLYEVGQIGLIKISDDGKWLAVSTVSPRPVKLLRLPSLQLVAELKPTSMPPRVAFSSDSKQLFTTDRATLLSFSIDTKVQETHLSLGAKVDDGILEMRVDGDNVYFVGASIQKWDYKNKKRIWIINLPTFQTSGGLAQEMGYDIYLNSFNNVLITQLRDYSLMFIDSSAGEIIKQLAQPFEIKAYPEHFNRKGDKLFGFHGNGVLWLWAARDR